MTVYLSQHDLELMRVEHVPLGMAGASVSLEPAQFPGLHLLNQVPLKRQQVTIESVWTFHLLFSPGLPAEPLRPPAALPPGLEAFRTVSEHYRPSQRPTINVNDPAATDTDPTSAGRNRLVHCDQAARDIGGLAHEMTRVPSATCTAIAGRAPVPRHDGQWSPDRRPDAFEDDDESWSRSFEAVVLVVTKLR